MTCNVPAVSGRCVRRSRAHIVRRFGPTAVGPTAASDQQQRLASSSSVRRRCQTCCSRVRRRVRPAAAVLDLQHVGPRPLLVDKLNTQALLCGAALEERVGKLHVWPRLVRYMRPVATSGRMQSMNLYPIIHLISSCATVSMHLSLTLSIQC